MAAGMVVASVARAQDSAARASRPSRITGVVIDSLHETALTNADVVIDGTNRTARTDSSGIFHLDSVPPRRDPARRLSSLLDSVGVSIVSPPLVVRAGDSLVITLATPSSATIAARACRNVPAETGALASPQSTGPGVIVGRILDADTDEPVGNVQVSFIWLQYEASTKTGFHQFRACAARDDWPERRLSTVPRAARRGRRARSDPPGWRRGGRGVTDRPDADPRTRCCRW